jgi:predicted nucleic acid-binding protein
MKYVLDSNVGLKWLLTEADSDKAIRIRNDFQRQVHDLIAPDVFPVEVAHSLTKAERQGRITPAEGRSHFRSMIAILPALHPYLPLLPRAYELSSQARIGVYDCLYVALIEREGCELIRADERLKRSLPSHRIVLLSSMP